MKNTQEKLSWPKLFGKFCFHLFQPIEEQIFNVLALCSANSPLNPLPLSSTELSYERHLINIF